MDEHDMLSVLCQKNCSQIEWITISWASPKEVPNLSIGVPFYDGMIRKSAGRRRLTT
jgi:hypothetical protein